MGAHIGALVVEDLVLDRENAAVAIDGGANVVTLLARMVRGDQVLAAILDPLDRPAQAHRRGTHQHVFGIKLAADTETAADMALVEVHRRERAPEHAGNLGAVPMRHLGGAMKLEHVVGRVVARNGAAGLDRDGRMPPDRERRLDHGVSGAEGGIDIAVTLAHDGRLGRAAGFELAGLRVGAKERRQFLDVEHDELGRILGEIGIVGEHRRDRLADVAHCAGREQPLPVGLQTFDPGQAEIDRRNVGNVGGRPHREHARFRQRRARVDRADAAVREIRAHDAHVQLLRKRNVGGKAATSGQQRAILEPLHRPADKFFLRLCVGRSHRAS